MEDILIANLDKETSRKVYESLGLEKIIKMTYDDYCVLVQQWEFSHDTLEEDDDAEAYEDLFLLA